jgi:hypothetical protein
MRSGIMTHGHCDLEASIRLGGAEMHATPLRFLKPMLAGRCPGLYRPLVEDVGGKYTWANQTRIRAGKVPSCICARLTHPAAGCLPSTALITEAWSCGGATRRMPS